MKKFLLSSSLFLSLAFLAYAGPEGKEVSKTVMTNPCPEWYADNEWNLSVWGTYAFTQEDWERDQYILNDHSWGGGADLKYFFHRYFGIGIEAFALRADRRSLELVEDESSEEDPEPLFESGNGPRERRFIGAVLGTFTFRFPIHCWRWSPYIYGGAGVIYGGGEKATFVDDEGDADADFTVISDTDAEFLGQIGGGWEFRFTRHFSLMNDVSWNFVSRDDSDFAMVRAGIGFAF
jgi:hypothetical protein